MYTQSDAAACHTGTWCRKKATVSAAPRNCQPCSQGLPHSGPHVRPAESHCPALLVLAPHALLCRRGEPAHNTKEGLNQGSEQVLRHGRPHHLQQRSAPSIM